MNLDEEIREALRAAVPPANAVTGYAAVQARLHPALPRRRSGLRVAAVASITVALVAAVAVGSFLAFRNLTQPDFVLAIAAKPVAATGTQQTTLAEAQSVHWERLPDPHAALNGMDTAWPEYGPKALVVDPSNPSILYAGEPEGLFKSTDDGRTWSQLSTLSGRPFMIGIDPASPSTVYAGTFIGEANATHLIRSDDGGFFWLDLSAADSLYGYEFGIWFDTATVPSTVYVLGHSAAWRSTDRGETWTPVGAGERQADAATNPVLSSTFSGLSGDILAPQVRVLRDRVLEALWNSLEGHLTVYSIEFKPYSPVMYAATSVGIVRAGAGLGSGPESGMWSLILGAAGESSVVVAPSSPVTVYAWNSAGLFRSLDSGTNWTRRAGAGLISVPAGTETVHGKLILVGGDSPDTLFAVTDRLLRSTDGGDTWSPVLEGMSATNSYATIVEDRKDPSVLFASTDSCQILKSTDTGATWAPMAPEQWVDPVVAVALDAHTPAVIYVVQRPSDGGASTLSRSFDSGSTWETVEAEGLGRYVRQVLFDPVLQDTIYVVCGRGVADASLYRSVDGGAAWQDITGKLSGKGIVSIGLDPTVSGGLYAATSDGIFRLVQEEVTDPRADETSNP
jgi:photosystem II stability/assembly factor-like uncharacterized protein